MSHLKIILDQEDMLLRIVTQADQADRRIAELETLLAVERAVTAELKDVIAYAARRK